MDLKEKLFHLIKSFHNFFLTETIPLSQGKKKKKKQKTFYWNAFPRKKSFLGKNR